MKTKTTLITLLAVGGGVYMLTKHGGKLGVTGPDGHYQSLGDWGSLGEWGSSGEELITAASETLNSLVENLPKTEAIRETLNTAIAGIGSTVTAHVPSLNNAINSAFGDAESQLLEQIAAGEGTSDFKARLKGYQSGYDVTLGYGAYVDDKAVQISRLTLDELDKLQTEMLNNPKNKWNSSAAGKYQIVRTTMRDLRKTLGLRGSDRFDAALQTRCAISLLNRRGYQKYKRGVITAKQFQYNLSLEWASIANPYTGQAIQHTGTTTADIQPIIQRLGVA